MQLHPAGTGHIALEQAFLIVHQHHGVAVVIHLILPQDQHEVAVVYGGGHAVALRLQPEVFLSPLKHADLHRLISDDLLILSGQHGAEDGQAHQGVGRDNAAMQPVLHLLRRPVRLDAGHVAAQQPVGIHAEMGGQPLQRGPVDVRGDALLPAQDSGFVDADQPRHLFQGFPGLTAAQR